MLEGGFTPCRGGSSAGEGGAGYCEPGYLGPRCELCDAAFGRKYFHGSTASCVDCPEPGPMAGLLVAAVIAAAALAAV
eukprot:5604046-Prymnesium_polylepis.2